jgi:hypothetical protein
METDYYYHCSSNTLDRRPSPVPDIMEPKNVFLAIRIQMGHCLWDQLADNWAKIEEFYIPFYSYMVQQQANVYTSFGSYTSQVTGMKLLG